MPNLLTMMDVTPTAQERINIDQESVLNPLRNRLAQVQLADAVRAGQLSQADADIISGSRDAENMLGAGNPLASATPPASPPADPMSSPAMLPTNQPGGANKLAPANAAAPQVGPPPSGGRDYKTLANAINTEQDPNKRVGMIRAYQTALQQDTAYYSAQGKEYADLQKSGIENAVEKGDMKGLKAIYEQAIKDLPSNPIVYQKAKMVMDFIDNGGKIYPDQSAETTITVAPENQEQYTKLLQPFLGDKLRPSVGEVYKIKMKNGQVISAVSTDAVGGGKEPAGVDAKYVDGIEKQLRADHPDWPKGKVEFEAAKQVRKENLANAKEKVQFSVNLREGLKEGKEKKEEAKAETDPGLDLAAANYAVTGRLPVGLSRQIGKAGLATVQRKAAEMVKGWGLTPTQWVAATSSARAAQHALNKIKDLNTKTQQLEGTAEQLLDRAAEQRSGLPQLTDVRKVDEWLRGLKSMQGDYKQRRIEGTVYEALVDYGRVMSGSVSQSGITDTARKEAVRLLMVADNEQAFKAIVENMKRTMALRLKANDKVEQGLLDVIGHTKNDTKVGGGFDQDAIAAELARRKSN